MTQKIKIRLTVLVLLIFVLMISGAFIAQYLPRQSLDTENIQGTVLSTPRDISKFSLQGMDGKPFTNEQLNAHWTMMFFGFTHCGSICPTIMAELSKMFSLLQHQSKQSLPMVVMVSVDPQRDDLTRLTRYVHAFNPAFYGATGDAVSLKKMTKELGIAYMQIADRDKKEGHYDIEHTGTILLFNPKGQLIAFFTTPHQAQALAKSYQLIAKY